MPSPFVSVPAGLPANAPVLVLFHQAGWSRGEYREIAPKLNELGYICLAIDQRSGKGVNGVANGNVTDPYAIAETLASIGFAPPVITVSSVCAPVDDATLREQLRASQGFYVFARKPDGDDA